MIPSRNMAAANMLLALLIVPLVVGSARGQALRVIPVNIQMSPGQKATTLTIVNEGSAATAIQVRSFAWSQPDGSDKLTPTVELLASPPLATIPPGGTQIVRLVLRQSPRGREAAYRILLDQIPPAAAPGMVQIAMRMSLPLFAQTATRAAPHLQFHIERTAGHAWLVAINDGSRHEAVRDIVLATSDGHMLKTEYGESPYVLAGVTRRWTIVLPPSMPLTDQTLLMKAKTDAGPLDQQVRVVGTP